MISDGNPGLKEALRRVWPEEGLKRGQALIARFWDRYPAAMECLEKDLEACLLSLKLPQAHWLRIRSR